MNLNLITNVLNYLEIDLANKFIKNFKNDNEKDFLIKSFASTQKLSYKNMKAKINNLDNRCGYCNTFLVGNYVIKIGLNDCKECDESNGTNINLCNKCNNTNLSRGQVEYKICMKGHKTLFYGVNYLS